MIFLSKSFAATAIIVLMLIFQIVTLGISLNSHPEISIFCTGPADGWLQWAFSLLHLSFLGLFALGVISLKWHRAKPLYIVALLIGLAALPVQAKLVHSKVLQCDAP
jgi:hypothetical protein